MNNPKPDNSAQGKQTSPVQSENTSKHPLDRYTASSKKEGDDKSPFYKSQAPSIELPKGGGALKGIDEKFTVNAVNGTAALQVGLPVTPGRGGFTPNLSLQYNSGSGNSEFGLGWGLSLTSIQRKTDKKLPEYNDVEESDVFVMAGAEDLVPMLDEGVPVITTPLDSEGNPAYSVKRYIPRIEGLFARIEKITRINTADAWWRVTTKDNIVTYYGLTAEGRIYDPGNDARIFKWLPQLSYDNKGNVQEYHYEEDSNDTMYNVPACVHERNRKNSIALFTNKYLKRVLYCNTDPVILSDTNVVYEPSMPSTPGYLMELVFDYGEHHATTPTPDAQSGHYWHCRKDPFSDFHSGFEIRTYRRCYRVLMFHRFEELQDETGLEAVLVRSLDITYANGNTNADTTTFAEADMPLSFTSKGYKYISSAYVSRSLPALTCTYQPLAWNNEIHNVSKKDAENIPQGLTGPYQWIDLYGEGLPGVLTEQGQGWHYKENLGDGKFAPAVQIAPKPSFAGLGNQMQWQDLDADGRRQLVSNNPAMPGYFELDDDQQWQSFRTFDQWVNVDWNSPYTRLLDLNGDGKPDVLLTEERAWRWYENKGTEGYAIGGEASTTYDEEQGPRILLNDKIQSIFLADMNGDGMTDIVRIQNGEVCYWPSLGYGRFGVKVNMSNAPLFDRPDQFNPTYLTLSDISGTGAPDILYLGRDKCTAWVNLAGNAFSDATIISPLPGIDPYSKIAVLDFLGSGTACIVWSSPLPQYTYAPLRYIDLMGGNKPYLMTTYANGMGKTTTLGYKHSTSFYLKDKAEGTPWATHLPFPVHCVETVTTADRVSQTTYTQSYTYHHGYYDHDEREFRGFGRVETLDTDIAIFNSGLDDHLDQPAVLTKTWYHTGAWMRERTLISKFEEEYYNVADWNLPGLAAYPAGLNVQEQREAHRALKGAMLRQEVYAPQYGGDEAAIPYTVTAQSYWVDLVQGLYNNRYAVFLTHQRENLVWHCERNAGDARILHDLTLEIDEYGNVLQSASVAYPRTGNSVSFEDITDALALIDINDAADVKDTMDDLLDMNETAAAYYQWLQQNDFLTPEMYFNAGIAQFPGTLPQYQLHTGDFTVEMWIRVSSAGGYQTLFQYEASCGGYPGGIHLFSASGTIYMFVCDGAYQYLQMHTTTAVLPADVWTHVAVTRTMPANISGWHIYVNGSAVTKASDGGSMTVGNINACTNSQKINLGGRTLFAPGYLYGAIRTMRWYNRAIDATGIATLYNSGHLRAPLSGAIFDLGINTVAGAVYDISPYNAGTATLIGSSGTTSFGYSLKGNNSGTALKGGTLAMAALQGKMLISSVKTGYTNDAITGRQYRLRLPCDVKNFELHGVAMPETPLWQPAALKDALDAATEIDYATPWGSGAELRLLEHHRTLYLADAIASSGAPLVKDQGELEPLAIPYQQYSLAYTDAILAGTPATGADLTTTGGYLREDAIAQFDTEAGDDTRYWLPGGTIQYAATPAATFYTPTGFTDPWGNETTITYWDNGTDNYYLLPETVTDALGNVTTAQAYDFRCLQATAIKDPNQNITEILYDALCMPVALAMMGKTGDSEGDELGSLNAEDSTDITKQGLFWGDPLANAAALLGHATWRCLYDLDSTNGIDPVCVAMIAREKHYQNSLITPSPLQVRISYTDGMGRLAMHKAQMPVLVVNNTPEKPHLPNGTYSWIGSGKTVYNNKGKTVMQFEPYYSTTHAYDPAAQAARTGVSPRIKYDPLGRVLKTDLPDGSYTQTEWDAWTQTVYDNNDTVLTSQWYTDWHGSADANKVYAADKAAEHDSTPTVMHLDVLAQPCYTIQHNRYPVSGTWTDVYYQSLALLDIQGNRTVVTDARGNSLSWKYNMLKGVLQQQSPDSGTQYALTAADGQPLLAWQGARAFSFEYDALRRPAAKSVTEGGTTKVLERMVYGEAFTGTPAYYNLLGKLYQQYDGAGLVETAAYDFKGNPLNSSRTFTTAYDVSPDWTTIGSVSMEGATYTTATTYDALNRPVKLTTPDAAQTNYTYDEAGLLFSVGVAGVHSLSTDIINAIYYNARGQRTIAEFKNGATTEYEYDPSTFRVTRIYTHRQKAGGVPHDYDDLQDLNYWYDPVGNITMQTDDAQQTIFFQNSIVTPDNDHTYDALYRLISTTGRELRGNNAAPVYNDSTRTAKSPVPFVNSATATDTTALRTYTQLYSYDATGNMTQMKHRVGGSDNWTRNFTIDPNSNHLTGTSIGSNTTTAETYTYDERGNMATGLNHLLSMAYNTANRLEHIKHTSTIDSYYQYDAAGQRVRKVVKNTSGTIQKTRIYISNWEQYTEKNYTTNVKSLERETLHIADDTGNIALVDTPTTRPGGSTELQLLRYQYSNHLGTASLELDKDAAIISYEEYYPYGSTSFQSGRTAAEVSLKRYRYTGKERDEESGFNYHGARYYIPWLARWSAADPLESKYAGMSAYNYGFNNPITWQDANGMEPGGGDDNLKDNKLSPEYKHALNGIKPFEIPSEKNSFPANDYIYSLKKDTTDDKQAPIVSPDKPPTDHEEMTLAYDGGVMKEVIVKAKHGYSTFKIGTSDDGKQAYILYDGKELKTGLIPYRFNNPGDMRPYKGEPQKGGLGVSNNTKSGYFTVFPDAKSGFDALKHSLLTSKNYKGKTLSEVIYKYAPPSENNTEKYIADLAISAGISRTTIVSDLPDDKLLLVMEGIAKIEGFYSKNKAANNKTYLAGQQGNPDWVNKVFKQYAATFKPQ